MILKKILNAFEKKIRYRFKNKLLITQALTHPSYFIDSKENVVNPNQFERLEFLGDRVLGLIISSMLFKKYKNLNEGDLSKKLSYLVQKKFLYKISIDLELEKFILYKFNNKNNNKVTSIFSDSVESIIGAIYLDGGYNPSYKFINMLWSSYLSLDISEIQDPKTLLQEISQQKLKKLPEYKLIKRSGPPHSPIFTISLKVLNLKIIKASGNSIREAEKNAASLAIRIINEKKIIKN